MGPITCQSTLTALAKQPFYVTQTTSIDTASHAYQLHQLANGKAKETAELGIKEARFPGKPTTPDLVIPNQSSTSPLKEISDLLNHLPLQACVELIRRLLTSISSLPTAAACLQAVLKTIILFVAKYGSTP